MTKEERKKYNKQYYLAHKDETKSSYEQYRQTHKKEISEYQKQYRLTHQGKILEYNKQYYLGHKKEMINYSNQFYQNHKEEMKEWRRQYLRTLNGKNVRRKSKAKRRELGFKPLNEPFPQCEGHHINKEYVVYIPKELHKSIFHNVWTGKNMEIINKLALEYLLNNNKKNIEYENKIKCA